MLNYQRVPPILGHLHLAKNDSLQDVAPFVLGPGFTRPHAIEQRINVSQIGLSFWAHINHLALTHRL